MLCEVDVGTCRTLVVWASLLFETSPNDPSIGVFSGSNWQSAIPGIGGLLKVEPVGRFCGTGPGSEMML